MIRFFKVARFVALLALAAGLGGCEQGNSAVLNVVGNVIPLATVVNDTLQCSVAGAQNYYADGVMDLSITNSFRYNALVENKLPGSQQINGSGPTQLRPESNLVTITSVRVVFERQATDGKTTSSPWNGKGKVVNGKVPVQQLEWEVPAYGTIQPGKSAVVSFDLVPPNAQPGVPVGLDWQARFQGFATRYTTVEKTLLRFTVQGTTAGGNTVQAGEVAYPVTVCWGCLLTVSGLPGAEDPKDQWKKCSQMQVGASYFPPCAPGNNDPMPCGYYCQVCQRAESTGVKTGACDQLFCPAE